MRKMIAIFCSLTLVFSLAACSQTDSDTPAQDEQQTEYGQVRQMDGSTVTLLLGEMSQMQMPGEASDMGDDETPPEMLGDPAGAEGEGSFAEMPGSETGNGQTPPEKLDGTTNTNGDGSLSELPDSGMGGGQTPPDKPDGGSDEGAPEKPEGDINARPGGQGGFVAGTETAVYDLSDTQIMVDNMGQTAGGSLEDITEGVILELVLEGDTVITATVRYNTGMGNMGFGGSQQFVEGEAANILDSDGSYSDVTYGSAGDDENALRIEGATVSLDNIKVLKTAGATSNTENGDFYGVNAGLLALDGAQVTITNATVETSAQNGNGMFSYGAGTVVTISDSVITTTADNSGGIQTTGGGTTIAKNLTIETSGSSAAAIRSDRGGGTVDVDGGNYMTNGYNSPAVYSTADITVKNSVLTATNSEALVIEGQNSIALVDCEVSGNMSNTAGTSSSMNVHNVMIYQSMSGDAEVGTSQFSMEGGSLTGLNGDMFYVTNTHCILSLENVEILNQDEAGYLLRIVGNDASRGWGNAGANGAQVEFTAVNQTLNGDIVVDTISNLTMLLSGNSNFTGTINIMDNEEGGTAVSDNAVVTIEKGSTWTLTGNCTVTSLENNGTINFNGYTITLADGTVLK